MRYLFITAIILPLMATQANTQEVAPFSLKHYGHFKKMMLTKKTDGVVDLKQAINQSHLYGVGASAHGTGEITVINGRLWLDYGADGLGNAKNEPAKDEQAVLLVTAKVEKWRDFVVPKDMSSEELHDFLLGKAANEGGNDDFGIDTTQAFPFMLEGIYFDLDWHVLNGLKPKGGHNGPLAKIKRWFMGLIGKGGHHGIYKKIKEHHAETAGSIIGFYSAASQGVYTHPGERWHQHLVIEKKRKAGHVDKFSVRKGTILKLPVS